MPRAVLVLLIVALGLGLFLWLVEMPAEHRRTESETASKHLVQFKHSDVQGLALHSPTGDIELTRTTQGGRDRWRITKPQPLEADSRAVDELLRILSLATITRVVDETGTDLASYGLVHPTLSISLHLPNGTQTISFGDAGPLTASLYAKRDYDPKVVLTTIDGRQILTKGLQDLRRKRVLEFERDRVTGLKVTTPQDAVVLHKQGQGDKSEWTIEQPMETGADQPEVRSLLFALEELQAQAFLDNPAERQRKKAELHHPMVTIILHQEGGDQQSADHTVTLYPNPANAMSAYAETTPDEPLYMVAGASAKDLAKSFFTLRTKQLMTGEPDRIKTLVIKKAGEEYSLSHEGTDWLVDGNAQAKADPRRVNMLLSRVMRLQAERPVVGKPKDLKTYGLDVPVVALTVADAQGNILGRMAIGRRVENLAFAQGSALKGVFQIRPDIVNEIPIKTEWLASETPRPPAARGTP